MKILAVADTVSKYLYDYYTPGKLDGFDLILACGDLSRSYLEFLVDASRCPVLYVRGNHDDTEKQMQKRVRRLRFKIMRKKGFDILLTHSPARHINDFDSLSHRGFECFKNLIEKYHPKYFVHGHIHMNYGINIPQRTEYGDTVIINACDYCIFDYDE